MFIGHQGIAFAAKAVAPRANLGLLFLATIWLDLVWPVLLLFDVEQVRIVPGITKVSPFDFVYYPYSHSLLFAMLWGLLFGRVIWAFTHDGRASIIAGLVVFSHWPLDLIVHREDLPLMPGSDEKFGLGLWDSWGGTLAAEFFTFGAGLLIYLAVTRAKDRIGSYGLYGFVAFLVAMYLLSLNAIPTADPRLLAVGALSMLLLALAAWWLDRHRASTSPRPDSPIAAAD
jgi:hypothetical protein